jgi:hypothetical protein
MSEKKIITRHKPCDAVMLLVQRMESHPEEFALNSTSKWQNLLTVVKRRVVDGDKDSLIVLDDFEVEMVWNKFRHAGKKSLHAFIMQKILEGNGEDNE